MVVGKFYPPHAGHHRLIDAAAAGCERVTVVVAPSRVESIPLELRLAWLRETHAATPWVRFVGVLDDTPVDYHDPAIWDAHCALFRSAAGDPVDAVYSSEAYGDELARRFSAVHVCVDPDRATVPVSGTAIRADPVAHWPHLAPPVRAWFTRRVVVAGAESTGTTTLARDLAAALRRRGGVWSNTRWVPEYGRELTAQKLAALRAVDPAATVSDVEWSPEDFVAVARAQNRAEDDAARDGAPILVCDTDSRVTQVWQERYLGAASPATVAAARLPDLYLLTDHAGVPFDDDGLRDGEHLREWMTGRFREVLGAAGVPVREVTGRPRTRLAAALAACDDLLARGWGLAPPLEARAGPGSGNAGPPDRVQFHLGR
ncbi:AAA family ATPase [Solwaraspora sp. WMMD1047]|uniref:AAA family ATPase n=1 Tax=Solwaraspora sp. WMMD1047 TaxID=3016102 RepID=UPI00241749F9|nr:AAA family ATPase [Solwaraspora sp. WMMD1047]MDG4833173.1 AAA family ATPase [Solwaraspora sp. WMMD1047]